MQPILESCGGLDVHKSMILACIAHGPLDKPLKFEIKKFPTMTNDLRKLSEWMKEYGVTAVAMESTGIYWKPIFNILEDDFDIVLANAQHIKNVPGRKTDVKDCQWIAHLFRNGLISGSFIGSPLFCMGNAMPPTSTETDHRSGVLNAEPLLLSKCPGFQHQDISLIGYLNPISPTRNSEEPPAPHTFSWKSV
ncbi:MAG: transposase [Euryarchaeota archaeon]|nr:transposase [Euryarchaeota archaeon]